MAATFSGERRLAMRFAAAAAVLLALSAAISAYWAAGGTGLLDTVGGSIARWGREGGLGVRIAMTLIVVVKLVAAWLPVAAVAPGRPVTRRLAWLEAAILVVYGGVLTGAGLAVQAGLLGAGRDADWRALDWHAYLWDPWFLVAGLLVLGALCAGRSAPPRRVGAEPVRGATGAGRATVAPVPEAVGEVGRTPKPAPPRR